jgi:hypothetical protein
MTYRPIATVLFIALCLWSVQAQSGRKHAKPAPAAPVPTATPEATPTPKKPDKEPEMLFYVGADRQDSFSTLPFSYHDAVVRGCVDRLRAGTSGAVDATDKSLSRGEAIKRAKSESGSYVVLLTLKLDTMARSYDDLVLEFVVFAPNTAKVMISGNSYPNGTRTGPVILGPGGGRTSPLYRERLLALAGEDAGNRILKALHFEVGIPKGP